MAAENGPDKTGKSRPGIADRAEISEAELERRRRQLEASLSTKIPRDTVERDAEGRKSAAGFGQALKISSEFIAGVLVGAAIGWVVDSMAGTSPWGLIVFLLLGFGAGVLNVLRSAGMVAEHRIRTPDGDGTKRR